MDEVSLRKIVDDTDNPPVFYKPQEVLWLHTWLNRAAIVVIVITVISSVVGFPAIYRVLFPFSQGDTTWNLGAVIITSILVIIGVAIQSLFYYFTFRALAFILKLLMEMEFNARDGK